MGEFVVIEKALLSELAESLAAELDARYPECNRSYPHIERRYQSEMEPVIKARTILAAPPAQEKPAPVPTGEHSYVRILTCVYCGQEYPQGTPASGAKILTDHIEKCEKHPMRAVIQQRDLLRSALVGIVGASKPDELKAMEVVIRSLHVPAEDSAVTINAIHALIDTDDGLRKPAEPEESA